MALFYRRENNSDETPLYSLSSQKTILVVGLGNIGKEYDGTRHNIGFACVDAFAEGQGFPKWIHKVDLKCHHTKMQIGDTNVILIKPTTYMNESGQAVAAVQRFYKLTCKETLVIHDELDLPFGQIRSKFTGGHAGNKGVASVLKYCEDGFARVRIGIANEKLEHMDASDFVLAKFLGEERDDVRKIIQEVSSMISEFTVSQSLGPETRSVV